MFRHHIDEKVTSTISIACNFTTVNIRLTHPKKSAVEHRVIIELGVIRQEAPATLAAGSDPGGQANATRTPLATAEFRHGPLV